jgi:hypothetical protein
MHISHILYSTICTPHDSLHLNNILHVPSASKGLLSIHKFKLDNHVFFEFPPYLFSIKIGQQGEFSFRDRAIVAC